jgi:hypothetical protein
MIRDITSEELVVDGGCGFLHPVALGGGWGRWGSPGKAAAAKADPILSCPEFPMKNEGGVRPYPLGTLSEPRRTVDSRQAGRLVRFVAVHLSEKGAEWRG